MLSIRKDLDTRNCWLSAPVYLTSSESADTKTEILCKNSIMNFFCVFPKKVQNEDHVLKKGLSLTGTKDTTYILLKEGPLNIFQNAARHSPPWV